MPAENGTAAHGQLPPLSRSANGGRVFGVPTSSPLTGVSIRFHGGGAVDPNGASGLSHLVEHCMYAEDGVGEEGLLFTYQRRGLLANAATVAESVDFYILAPNDAMGEVIALERRRFDQPTRRVNQAVINREREIIRREYEHRVLRHRHGDYVRELLSRGPHPQARFGRPPIGDLEELARVGANDVVDHMSRLIVAPGCTIGVVGGAVSEELMDSLASLVEQLPTGATLADVPTPALGAPRPLPETVEGSCFMLFELPSAGTPLTMRVRVAREAMLAAARAGETSQAVKLGRIDFYPRYRRPSFGVLELRCSRLVPAAEIWVHVQDSQARAQEFLSTAALHVAGVVNQEMSSMSGQARLLSEAKAAGVADDSLGLYPSLLVGDEARDASGLAHFGQAGFRGCAVRV